LTAMSATPQTPAEAKGGATCAEQTESAPRTEYRSHRDMHVRATGFRPNDQVERRAATTIDK
jgi:hypothetical protein